MPDIGIQIKAVPVVDQKSFNEAVNTYQKMVNSHPESFKIKFSADTSSIKLAVRDISNQFNSLKNATQSIKLGYDYEGFVEKHKQKVKELESEYVNLKVKMAEASEQLYGAAKESRMNALKKKIIEVGAEIKSTFNASELKNFEDTVGKISKIGVFGSEQVVNITKAQESISGLSTRMVELAGVGENLIKVRQVLNEDGQWEIVSVKTVNNVKELETQIAKLMNQIKVLKTGFGGDTSVGFELDYLAEGLQSIDVHSKDARQKILEVSNSIEQFKGKLNGSSGALSQYKRLTRGITDDLIKLNAEQLKGKNANQQYITSLQQAIEQKKNDRKIVESQIQTSKDLSEMERTLQEENVRLSKTIEEQNAAAKKQKNLLYNVASGMEEAAARVINYTLAYRALWKVVQLMRDSIEIAEELNAAFTDIELVTMGTTESMQKLRDEYAQLAVEMSATVQEVAEGSDEWLRQGKTAEETAELLRSSMVLSRIGAIDSADATSYLTSVLNGYKMEVEDVMHVVDAMSQVDIESASSVDDLAVALQRSANTADMAGVSFEKLVAYAGTIREVTQKSASTVGESLKTIFSRMGSVAAGKFLDEDLETEYEDFDTFVNDTEKVLSKLGIRLRDTNHQFRNVEDILDEVAQSWSTYNDLEKNALATSIAGVRQRENFIALMENYDKVLDLTESAYNSNGKAMEKYNIYQDSIEASQQRIHALWEKWVMNMDIEEVIKYLLDLGEAFMTVFSSDLITYLLKMTPAIISFAGALKILQGVLATNTLASGGIMGAIIGVVKANPVTTILTIAGAVITLIGVMEKFIVTNEDLKENISALSNEIEQNQSEIDSYKEKISDVSSRIEELYNKKSSGSLSIVEQEELDNLILENKELQNQINLLEEKNNLANKEAVEDAEKLYKNTSETEVSVGEYGEITSEVKYVDQLINDKIKRINELNDKIKNETDYDKISEYISERDELSSSVIDDVELSQQILNVLGEDSEIGKKLKQAIDAYYNSLQETQDKINEIIEDSENQDVVSELKLLAEQGQLTSEVLNDIRFAGIISSLKELGLDTSDIIEIFKNLSKTASETSNSISKISAASMLNNIEAKVSAVASAQKELAKTGYISGDAVKELVDAGYDLGNSLTVTENGYKINKSALDALLVSQREEYVQSVNEARTAAAALVGYKAEESAAYDEVTNSILAKLEAQIAETAASANMYMTQMNNAFVRGDTEKSSEYGQQWKNYMQQYNALKESKTNLDNALYNLDMYDSTAAYVKKNTSSSSSSSSSSSNKETPFERDIRILEHKLYLAEQWADVYKDNSETELEYQEKINEQIEIYEQLMERTHQEAEEYRKKGYSENSEEIQELQKKYWEYYNSRKDILDDYAKYKEEKEQEMIDETEEALDKVKDAIDDLLDDAQDKLDEQLDNLDYQISKLEAIRDLTSSYYEVINEVNSGMRDLNNELESSKKTYEYMDESLRDTIFNDEDYEKLSNKLQDIASESKDLYDSYLEELEMLTEDEIYKAEYITEEFERQYNYKMMEYDIAEAELELVKAQTVLQNTLANRNVRMFKDGQWIWTADHEAVEDAQEAVNEAEANKEDAEIKLKQQQVIDHYEELIDDLGLQKEAAKAEFDQLKEMWEEIQEQLTTEENSMQVLLETINETDIPLFKSIIGNVGDALQGVVDKAYSIIGGSSPNISSGSSSSSSGGYHFDYDKNTSGGWTEEEMNEGFTGGSSSSHNGYGSRDEFNNAIQDAFDKSSSTGERVDLGGGLYIDANKSKGYDNGGILNGLGGIKATKSDEVVFGPEISSKLLNPEMSRSFLDSSEAISKIMDNSYGLENLMSILSDIVISGKTETNDSHDIYLDGSMFSNIRKSDYDCISSIIKRYIPISKG